MAVLPERSVTDSSRDIGNTFLSSSELCVAVENGVGASFSKACGKVRRSFP